MSNHTRSIPSFDRSSLTPPLDATPTRPRKPARMKPQSESLKRRLHIMNPAAPRAARRYLEESCRMDQDRDRRPERERHVASFRTQLDSDDAGAGPLDKDDTPYHGRSSSRLRVASVGGSRDGRITTRRKSKSVFIQTRSHPAPLTPYRPTRDPSLEPPTSAQPPANSPPQLFEDHRFSDPRPSAVSRAKKRIKSAKYIDNSDGYSSQEDRRGWKRSRHAGSGGSSRSVKPRPVRDWSMIRTPSPPTPRPPPLPPLPPLPPNPSDTELPSLLELTRGSAGMPSGEVKTEALIDDEAMESEGDVEDDVTMFDAGRQNTRSEDDYDYDDPFINDGALSSEDDEASEDTHIPPSKATRRKLRRPFEERSKTLTTYCLYSSDDDDREDDDSKLRSLKKTTRGGHSAVNQPGPSSASKDKGKGKGVSAESPVPSDHGALSDEALADPEMSEWEKGQLEMAIAESKRLQRPGVIGESSMQGSQVSSPHAKAMFGTPSPSLSTPKARAMFGTPSSTSSQPTSALPNPVLPAHEPPMTMQELVRASMANNASSSEQDAPPPPPEPTAPPSEGIQLLMLCTPDDIPAVCGVSHPSYQDPILRPHYAGLVNLLPGHIEPWGNMAGPGFVMFQAWGDQCPRMNARLALAAVNFKESGSFRNPSRCSPCDVGLYDVPGVADRFHFYCAGENPTRMIAVSCGMVDKTQLGEPPEGGFRQRWIQAILHNQDWQRYKGFICMVSGHEHLYCQYNKHALQFSTRPIGTVDSSDRNGKGVWKKKVAEGGGLRVPRSMMFGSGGASEGGTNKMVMDGFSLPGEDHVPVYDARSATTFDFNTDLPRLAEVLPPWTEGEIPNGSFVVVGHTLAIYRARNGNWTLGCNIHWAIVLGCSKDG